MAQREELSINKLLNANGNSVIFAAAAPTAGKLGDIVFNTAPTAGGSIGWVCTTGGATATWKTFGAIAA